MIIRFSSIMSCLHSVFLGGIINCSAKFLSSKRLI
uniref:Uncharacterized protein n=1 Tax=Arundo donax TaxID=35708 RepID=A0A0A9BGL9_ARUDO